MGGCLISRTASCMEDRLSRPKVDGVSVFVFLSFFLS